MKQLLKKLVLFSMTAVLSLGAFAGCSKEDEAFVPPKKTPPQELSAPTTNLAVPVFTTDKNFVIFADVPVNPTVENLEVYKAAGFTHYNMTEDHIRLSILENANAYSNLDIEMVTTEDINPAYLSALDNCEQVGLKYLIRNYYADSDYFVNDNAGERQYDLFNGTYRIPTRNITTELTNQNTSFGGYYMGDEPSWDKISKFDKLVEWYNTNGNKSDDTFWHLNLLQSYGSYYFRETVKGEDGSTTKVNHTYEEYVDHYCDKVLSKVNGAKTLGTDYYPLLEGGEYAPDYIKDGLVYDYFIIANKTKEMIAEGHDVRTNFCIQSYETSSIKTDGVRELTSQADITFQTNLAMAFGTKSFQYYTYCTYAGREPGILDNTLEPGKMYPWVQTANSYAQFMAEAILNMSWNGAKVYQGQQIKNPTNAEAFKKVSKYELADFALISSIVARLDTVVSEFKDANGNKAYMFVNYSEPGLGLSGDVFVNFSSKVNKAVIYQNGEKKVVDVENNKLKLTLDAGGGAFVYPVYEGGVAE